jgi:hypothetical protein
MGLQGSNLIPSNTIRMILLLPAVPVYLLLSSPYLLTYAQVKSHNMVAQTEPTPCTEVCSTHHCQYIGICWYPCSSLVD